MNLRKNQTAKGVFNRRSFCAVAGAAAAAALAGARAEAESGLAGEDAPGVKLQTGNGEWTYEVVAGWGRLPAGRQMW